MTFGTLLASKTIMKATIKQIVTRQGKAAGRPFDYQMATLACGHFTTDNLDAKEIDCTQCDHEQNTIVRMKAERADIFRCRFRYDSYWFYKRDQTSPSGVTLMFGAPKSAKVESALAELRLSPLSPTEF